MFIFLVYSLVLCWGNVSNSNVTMKFSQLHYFLSQNVWGTKDIMSPLSKSWEGHVPPVPLKLVPWLVDPISKKCFLGDPLMDSLDQCSSTFFVTVHS